MPALAPPCARELGADSVTLEWASGGAAATTLECRYGDGTPDASVEGGNADWVTLYDGPQCSFKARSLVRWEIQRTRRDMAI